jgi:DNA polymerase I-like protein with 3'-5' exonuclease and polymerase domains
MITIDIETYDPLLNTLGPSCRYGQGAMLSAVYRQDGETHYLPGAKWTGKLDAQKKPTFTKCPAETVKQLKALMQTPDDKVFANASYELAWFEALGAWGRKIHQQSLLKDYTKHGRMYDVLITETLLQGTIGWSLDKCAKLYELAPKPVAKLVEAVVARLHRAGLTKEAAYVKACEGVKFTKGDGKIPGDVRAWLWCLTNDNEGQALLEEYNRHDVEVTEQVHLLQLENPDIKAPVHTIESLTIPVIALMQNAGMHVSLQNLTTLQQGIKKRIREVTEQIITSFGQDIPETLTDETREILGKQFNLTKSKNGKYSVTKEQLAKVEHPAAALLVERTMLNKLLSTFVSTVLTKIHNNKVYPKIYQIGTDGGGTITGRLSYQGINLQNQPNPKGEDTGTTSRELTKLVRQIFVPSAGKKLVSADYASQEPRIQAHLAVILNAPGGEGLQKAYLDNPELSLHEYVRDLCNEALSAMGEEPFMQKHHAKPINLGIPYGSGKKKVAAQISPDPAIGGKVYDLYVEAFPSILWLRNYQQKEADRLGYSLTIFGRKSRFSEYETDTYGMKRKYRLDDDGFNALSKATKGIVGSPLFIQEWFETLAPEPFKGLPPLLKRSRTYSALNRVVQGSGADQTKLAMSRMYYLCGILPLIQVHDEIVFEISDEELHRVPEIIDVAMNKAVTLKVPIVTEYEVFEDGWYSKVIECGKL